MTFHDFIELYLKDMEGRLKPSTIANKRFLIDLKITPYFGKMPLDAIQATDIRKWQNTLTSYRDEKGAPYSATYLKTINNQRALLQRYADERNYPNTRFIYDDVILERTSTAPDGRKSWN